jgi:hypothetical protein
MEGIRARAAYSVWPLGALPSRAGSNATHANEAGLQEATQAVATHTSAEGVFQGRPAHSFELATGNWQLARPQMTRESPSASTDAQQFQAWQSQAVFRVNNLRDHLQSYPALETADTRGAVCRAGSAMAAGEAKPNIGMKTSKELPIC